MKLPAVVAGAPENIKEPEEDAGDGEGPTTDCWPNETKGIQSNKPSAP
jgi:hypothetical protein